VQEGGDLKAKAPLLKEEGYKLLRLRRKTTKRQGREREELYS